MSYGVPRDAMQLMDKPMAEKFNFPGLQDKGVTAPPPVEEAPMPEPDVKKTARVKKAKDTPAPQPSPAGRKPLKLGKPKG